MWNLYLIGPGQLAAERSRGVSCPGHSNSFDGIITEPQLTVKGDQMKIKYNFPEGIALPINVRICHGVKDMLSSKRDGKKLLYMQMIY